MVDQQLVCSALSTHPHVKVIITSDKREAKTSLGNSDQNISGISSIKRGKEIYYYN